MNTARSALNLLATMMALVVMAPVCTQNPENTMRLTSSAFDNESMIPSEYTCDGSDISPPLAWTNAPKGTKSFALIMEDPDAPKGTFIHWVAWNIDAKATGLPPGITASASKNQLVQGKNSADKLGYFGPCPPSGTHRYFFTIYALDSSLSLKPDASKSDLLPAMQGKILASGQLMGRYQRTN